MECANATATAENATAAAAAFLVCVANVSTRADLLETANDLFDMVAKGIVKIAVNHTYPLKETAAAHRDLEARKTTGSVVLLP